MTIKGMPMLNAHASLSYGNRLRSHLVIMLAALATGSKTGPASDIHFTCARAIHTFMEYQPFICAGCVKCLVGWS